MNQPLHTSKIRNGHFSKPKKMEIAALTYQKGWELTFDLMESYFGEKEVKGIKGSGLG